MHINNHLKHKWFQCSNQKDRAAEWLRKQDPYICCLQEIHFKWKDTHRQKVKGWKKILHAQGKENKAGVAVLTIKIDFKTKATYSKRQRTLHNDKGNNPTRGFNLRKHLHFQHRSN